MTTYDLPWVNAEVKKIWNKSDKWRLKDGCLEFSILTSDFEREWFPSYQSPSHVEKFIRDWFLIGGLNSLVPSDLHEFVLKEGVELMSYDPDEHLLNEEFISKVVIECLIDNDRDAAIEIIDTYFERKRKCEAKDKGKICPAK